MEALIPKIPINVHYGRQAKYLKSALPEALGAVSGDSSRVMDKPNPTEPTINKPTKSGTSTILTKRRLVKGMKNITHTHT